MKLHKLVSPCELHPLSVPRRTAPTDTGVNVLKAYARSLPIPGMKGWPFKEQSSLKCVSVGFQEQDLKAIDQLETWVSDFRKKGLSAMESGISSLEGGQGSGPSSELHVQDVQEVVESGSSDSD